MGRWGLLVWLVLAGCSESSVEKAPWVPPKKPEPVKLLVDVSVLPGKTKKEVQEHLGEPDKCETIKIGSVGKVPQCTYWDGKAEVVYIDKMADWITIYPEDLSFRKESIQAFGFSTVLTPGPTPMPESVIYWANYSGFIGINFAPGPNDTISFAHFKARTE